MFAWLRTTAVAATVAVFVIGAAAVADAQPYGPPYGGPYGAPYGPARLRTVQSEPAVACQNQQDLRRFLTAYANGNRWRARETATNSCAILSTGTRVFIMEPPTALSVWQFQTRQTVTYRDVLVRVLNGPARGYVGYILVDTIR